jgi:ribosomal protein S21
MALSGHERRGKMGSRRKDGTIPVVSQVHPTSYFGIASADKTQLMGVKVHVHGGDVQDALRRLKKRLEIAKLFPVASARWYKKKLHYYLKPSHLRRRRHLAEQMAGKYVPFDCQWRIPKHMCKGKSWPKDWWRHLQ